MLVKTNEIYKNRISGKTVQVLCVDKVFPSFSKNAYYLLVWFQDKEIGENHCVLEFDFVKEYEEC